MRDLLMRRLAIAIGSIALLALFSSLIATGVAQLGAGEADAINQAGSLRMLAWKMVAAAEAGDEEGLGNTQALFDRRLDDLGTVAHGMIGVGRSVTETLQEVRADWQTNLRPRLTAPRGSVSPADLAAETGRLVDRIDEAVSLVESDLEAKLRFLRLAQAALLVLIVAVSLVTLQAFVRIYRRLRTEVLDKTRELEHSNHSLDLLYRTTSRLSAGELTQEKLLDILHDVEGELGLGQGIICVRQNQEDRAYPLATHMPEAERAALCDRLGCSICFGAEGERQIAVHHVGDTELVAVPLAGGGVWEGVMPFQIKPGTTLEPWQMQVLEALGKHIATALANTRRAEERHRLAVHEERSTIARELHDSIAQSLSYLKIQISLLQGRIRHIHHPELLAIVEELKVGLGSAYSELRELLTTFRLSPSQTPFTDSIALMAQEFARRCGIPVEVELHMDSLELSANEEVHVTSIIREALTNVQHHAKASWAQIRLDADTLRRVHAVVEDDGIGIGDRAGGPNRHHYGLTIMKDRAAILKGQLHVAPRAGGGTRVELSFVANTPYAHEDRHPGEAA